MIEYLKPLFMIILILWCSDLLLSVVMSAHSKRVFSSDKKYSFAALWFPTAHEYLF